MTSVVNHLAVIGLGLMGSSVARGAHDFGLAKKITAYDKNPLSLQYGANHHFLNEVSESLEDAVKDADLIVLATPIGALAEMAAAIAPHVKKGAVVTDVGSVKIAAMEAIRPNLNPHTTYIPGHPVAGSEQSGVVAGKADMFAGKRVILCPEGKESTGLNEVTAFWQGFGAQVEYMPADLHDKIYSYMSHLPQRLAFAAGEMLQAYLPVKKDGPFKKFTRLCHSDPHMWEEIFAANHKHLDHALARYVVMLEQIRQELNFEEKPSTDPLLADEEIFTHVMPYLLATCLIGTLMQEEMNQGFRFARYAGTGFIDFTTPADEDPDKLLEYISNNASATVAAITRFMDILSRQIVIKD